MWRLASVRVYCLCSHYYNERNLISQKFYRIGGYSLNFQLSFWQNVTFKYRTYMTEKMLNGRFLKHPVSEARIVCVLMETYV